MAKRTAIAGDDFGPEKILAILGLISAGTIIARAAKGERVTGPQLFGALLTVFFFFK